MSEEYYRHLNGDLGLEFDLFALEHPEWMEHNVPPGAIVVMQTEDAAFNAWARGIVEKNRHLERPPRPIVLVHIRELVPPRSRIMRADAELVAATDSKSICWGDMRAEYISRSGCNCGGIRMATHGPEAKTGGTGMTAADFSRLHADLGSAFSCYVAAHLDSPLLEHLTDETAIVFQTDAPDFNARALQFARECRERDDNPDRPITLIYVRVPNSPSAENVNWDQAKILARLVLKPDRTKAPTST